MNAKPCFFSYLFKSNFALPVIIISTVVTVFVIATPAIYMPVYLEHVCKLSEKLDVPAFVRDSPHVKKFEEKYSEYVIDEHVMELLTLPPKFSYQFEANEGGKKVELVRINDSCEDEDFYMYLTCWDGQEVAYTINGEEAVLEHLGSYDCLDS